MCPGCQQVLMRVLTPYLWPLMTTTLPVRLEPGPSFLCCPWSAFLDGGSKPWPSSSSSCSPDAWFSFRIPSAKPAGRLWKNKNGCQQEPAFFQQDDSRGVVVYRLYLYSTREILQMCDETISQEVFSHQLFTSVTTSSGQPNKQKKHLATHTS